MRESAERVQYITEYIVSYRAKIEALSYGACHQCSEVSVLENIRVR